MAAKSAYQRLSKQRQRFVDAIVEGKSGAEAAREANYAERSARQIANRLLTKADIRDAIEERNAIAVQNAELSQEWVIERLMKEATRVDDNSTHAGRVSALGLLTKRVGGFTDKHEHSGPGGTPIAVTEIKMVPVAPKKV